MTHIFGFLSGLELGAMLLRDEVEQVKNPNSEIILITFFTPQNWEKYVKLVLWTLFWLGFGAALGINMVGAANFQGFWHQNFWDPEWIPNKLKSSCTT